MILTIPAWARAQQPDSSPRFVLPAITVSAARTTSPATKVPLALHSLTRDMIGHARLTWGLDEALNQIPGVFVANRYNFSLDQRVAIRGFGSRATFGLRGIKILLDGIPQTLPDGQSQLTNLELGAVDRIEVVRGAASALFGNAAGGVISIWSDPTPPAEATETVRMTGGVSQRHPDRGWLKWQTTTVLRVGSGSGELLVSRLRYDGERNHSGADFRNVNARVALPLSRGWTLTALTDLGVDPQADNPGALTLAELRANRDSAPAINLSTNAGKDVTQAQSGVSLRRTTPDGGETAIAVFGLIRNLKNPQTFAYIDLDRAAYGARVSAMRPLALAGRPLRLTTGFDLQQQRDDRHNFGNAGGRPDTVRALDQLEHVTELGPFVQSAVDIAPKLTVSAGLRYDWVRFAVADRLITPTNPDDSGRRLMHALSGSAGAAFVPGPAVTLYTNFGTSFETPTTTELTNRPDSAGGFNPSLQPQHARMIEVGARGTVASHATWSAALYRATVRDELISYEVPSAPQRRFFRNAGTVRHQGVELGGQLWVWRGVRVSGAYTVADLHYLQYAFSPDTAHTFILDGRAVPGVPRYFGRIALTVAPRAALAPGLWAEVETTHASGYLVDDTLSVRTNPWWATNVRVGWRGPLAGARVESFVGVTNAFNRFYVGSVSINAARGRYYEPAPGRGVYVGFEFGAGR
jgi:iron complex outermembrane receptor protein